MLQKCSTKCSIKFSTKRLLLVSTVAMVNLGMISIGEISAQTEANPKNSPKKTSSSDLKNSTKSAPTVTVPTVKNVTVKNVAQNKVTKTTNPKNKVTNPPVLQNRLPFTAKDLQQPTIAYKPSPSIKISTKPDSNLVEAVQNKIAQTEPTSNSPFIKIEPLSIKPSYYPGLNAGTPSGFGLETGDAFVGLFAATAGKLRDRVDGSIALATGIGDANKYFAVEGVFNINSIRSFASNGSFDLKVHKIIYGDAENQVGVAVGWTNFANYGVNAGGTSSSVYGVATLSRLTDPSSKDNPKPLVISAGVGGGTYRKSDSNGGVGVFGSIGYLLDPQWAVSSAWSGQGLNFAVGFLPDRTLPLNINLTYSDVTNNSNAGTQLILGITYGFNYLGRR